MKHYFTLNNETWTIRLNITHKKKNCKHDVEIAHSFYRTPVMLSSPFLPGHGYNEMCLTCLLEAIDKVAKKDKAVFDAAAGILDDLQYFQPEQIVMKGETCHSNTK